MTCFFVAAISEWRNPADIEVPAHEDTIVKLLIKNYCTILLAYFRCTRTYGYISDCDLKRTGMNKEGLWYEAQVAAEQSLHHPQARSLSLCLGRDDVDMLTFYAHMYSICNWLCIKTACVSIQFWCTIYSEYCTARTSESFCPNFTHKNVIFILETKIICVW